MPLIFKRVPHPKTDALIELYTQAGLPRPLCDAARITRMLEHSNLVISAWDGDRLVGVARSITDWAWCCYLADLAVLPAYQSQGIGKRLIDLTREAVGPESIVLLLSVPDALDYYPKVGLEKVNNGFIIHREQ
jgi:GNAT superfamily N-acetyltransferase